MLKRLSVCVNNELNKIARSEKLTLLLSKKPSKLHTTHAFVPT
ncbi:hypothetical protein PS914_03219 [Pseudomonas fluorescens]|nr:hypothetical protein PS914_03219 [Pseudomonas fluorescens]